MVNQDRNSLTAVRIIISRQSCTDTFLQYYANHTDHKTITRIQLYIQQCRHLLVKVVTGVSHPNVSPLDDSPLNVKSERLCWPTAAEGHLCWPMAAEGRLCWPTAAEGRLCWPTAAEGRYINTWIQCNTINVKVHVNIVF